LAGVLPAAKRDDQLVHFIKGRTDVAMTRDELSCLEPKQWLDDKVNSHPLIMLAPLIVRERLNDSGRHRHSEMRCHRHSEICVPKRL